MLHIYSAHFQSTVQLEPTASRVNKSQETEVFRAVPNIRWSPHIFTFTMLHPRPNSLSQTYKFVCTVLKSLQVAAFPWSGAHTDNILVEIHMPSTLEEAKEPVPKTKERTTNIQSQMRDLDSVQLALSCFQDAHSSKQREAIRQGVLRMLAGSKEIVRIWSLCSPDFSARFPHVNFRGTCIITHTVGTMELMINITYLQLKKKCLLQLSFISQIYHFLYISYKLKYIFFLGQNKLSGTFLIILTPCLCEKSVPANAAGLWTNYNAPWPSNQHVYREMLNKYSNMSNAHSTMNLRSSLICPICMPETNGQSKPQCT